VSGFSTHGLLISNYLAISMSKISAYRQKRKLWPLHLQYPTIDTYKKINTYINVRKLVSRYQSQHPIPLNLLRDLSKKKKLLRNFDSLL
jgi:hypothetical protein